jgi:hypothetical protein
MIVAILWTRKAVGKWRNDEIVDRVLFYKTLGKLGEE